MTSFLYLSPENSLRNAATPVTSRFSSLQSCAPTSLRIIDTRKSCRKPLTPLRSGSKISRRFRSPRHGPSNGTHTPDITRSPKLTKGCQIRALNNLLLGVCVSGFFLFSFCPYLESQQHNLNSLTSQLFGFNHAAHFSRIILLNAGSQEPVSQVCV